MEYFATYRIPRLPIGTPVRRTDPYTDTVFVEADILGMTDGEEEVCVGKLGIRRVMLPKIINEHRSLFEAMDSIDQLQHEIYAAVWDYDQDTWTIDDAIGVGELLIFGPIEFAERASLHGFDVNKILDDMVYHVSGDAAVVVFLEDYAALTHFNFERCKHLEGIGYALATARGGLSAPQSETSV